MLMKNVRWIDYMLLVFMFIFLFVYWFFVKNASFQENANVQPELYKGTINMWDAPTYTANGAKFSFINTLNADFLQDKKNLLFEMTYLDSDDMYTRALTASKAQDTPDLMRVYVDGQQIDCSKIAVKNDFNPTVAAFGPESGFCLYENKLIVDVCYSVSVVLVNTDLLNEAGVSFEERVFSEDALFEAAGKVKEKWGDEADFRVIDFSTLDMSGCMPLVLNQDYTLDYSLLETIKKEFWADHTYHEQNEEPLSAFESFAAQKCAFYFCSLSDVARFMAANPSFSYEVALFSKGETLYLYVNDKVSYGAFFSDDEKKNAMLEKYLLYLCTQKTAKMCDVAVLLPVFDDEQRQSAYEHLNMIRSLNVEKLFFDNVKLVQQRDAFSERLNGMFGVSR